VSRQRRAPVAPAVHLAGSEEQDDGDGEPAQPEPQPPREQCGGEHQQRAEHDRQPPHPHERTEQGERNAADEEKDRNQAHRLLLPQRG
jgi:hypothetical protein